MDSPWRLFETARDKLLKAYAAAKSPFEASTQPYKSVKTLVGEVQEFHPTAAPSMAHIVFRKGQILEWFAYGLGDGDIGTGIPGVTREVTDALTNLVNGRETNGSEEFIVEALSASQQGMRIKWTLAGAQASPGGAEAINPASVEVLSAYAGTTELYDPGGLATPPQMWGPFNLEDAIFMAIRPVLSLEIEFDRKKTQHIGTLDQLFEGSGKSYLRTSGSPEPSARWKIPEGKIWRRKGQADSDFVVRGTLRDTIIVPIDLPPNVLGVTRDVGTRPTLVLLDVAMRAHGLSIQQVSQN